MLIHKHIKKRRDFENDVNIQSQQSKTTRYQQDVLCHFQKDLEKGTNLSQLQIMTGISQIVQTKVKNRTQSILSLSLSKVL